MAVTNCDLPSVAVRDRGVDVRLRRGAVAMRAVSAEGTQTGETEGKGDAVERRGDGDAVCGAVCGGW